MFMSPIISDELSLHNFLKQLNFNFYLTKPQLKHFESIMNSMIIKDITVKYPMQRSLASPRHRTSITSFLSKSNWNENF
jgi:formate hydrogenlyase subunit 6/NADH:ubiquinone oxidoreductase subunit I